MDLAADTCSSSAGWAGLERQRGLQQRAHGRHHRAQVQRAGHGLGGGGGGQHLVIQRDQAAHLGQQLAPGVAQHHGLALAGEQIAAQLGFQRAHLLAHGGLRQRHARGGGGKGAFGRHGNEGTQKTDAAHGL
jgi:hypothetical protein